MEGLKFSKDVLKNLLWNLLSKEAQDVMFPHYAELYVDMLINNFYTRPSLTQVGVIGV